MGRRTGFGGTGFGCVDVGFADSDVGFVSGAMGFGAVDAPDGADGEGVALTGRGRAGVGVAAVRVFSNSSASNGNWSSTPFGRTVTVDPSRDITRADAPAGRSSDGIGSRR